MNLFKNSTRKFVFADVLKKELGAVSSMEKRFVADLGDRPWHLTKGEDPNRLQNDWNTLGSSPLIGYSLPRPQGLTRVRCRWLWVQRTKRPPWHQQGHNGNGILGAILGKRENASAPFSSALPFWGCCVLVAERWDGTSISTSSLSAVKWTLTSMESPKIKY